jgi:hypothetical protein
MSGPDYNANVVIWSTHTQEPGIPADPSPSQTVFAQPQEAAQFLGSADILRESLNAARSITYHGEYDRDVALLKETIGEGCPTRFCKRGVQVGERW